MAEVKAGWLTKQGQIVKNWKMRYFVLYDSGRLEYFKTEEVSFFSFLTYLNRIGKTNVLDLSWSVEAQIVWIY